MGTDIGRDGSGNRYGHGDGCGHGSGYGHGSVNRIMNGQGERNGYGSALSVLSSVETVL